MFQSKYWHCTPEQISWTLSVAKFTVIFCDSLSHSSPLCLDDVVNGRPLSCFLVFQSYLWHKTTEQISRTEIVSKFTVTFCNSVTFVLPLSWWRCWWTSSKLFSCFQAEGGDAGLADVEEADMASSEEGDEEEEDSSGKCRHYMAGVLNQFCFVNPQNVKNYHW